MQSVPSIAQGALAEGLVLSNTYRLGKLIGRGGMGEVYEAIHQRTGAAFAVKVLLADFTGDARILARFKAEAEITSRLHHPNIVKVFDFDELPDGRPFFAMERLRGRELASYVGPGRPMGLSEVTSIVDQVVSALAAAHAAGVIHRDLKPANIFIEKVVGRERDLVRVLDFGISKVRDGQSATRTAAVIGTPHYMSPEQALGRAKALDARSDLFSLGAIAYELLTGHRAFGGDDPEADEPAPTVLFRVVHGEPRPFSELGLNLPRVEAVIRKALAKAPDGRYVDAATLGKAFEEAAREDEGGTDRVARQALTLSEPPWKQPPGESTPSGSAGETQSLEAARLRPVEAKRRGKAPSAHERKGGGSSARWTGGGLAAAMVVSVLAALIAFKTMRAGPSTPEPAPPPLALALAPAAEVSRPEPAPVQPPTILVVEVDDAPAAVTAWEGANQKSLPLTWSASAASSQGPHTVTFKAPGYKDLVVTIRPETTRRISLKMKRQHAAKPVKETTPIHNLDI